VSTSRVLRLDMIPRVWDGQYRLKVERVRSGLNPLLIDSDFRLAHSSGVLAEGISRTDACQSEY